MNNKKNDIEREAYETNAYIQKLLLANPLREPILRSAIQELELPTGSRGLDAGCGIGHPALLLAEAVGPDGHVTGVDQSSECVTCAKKIAEKAGLSEQVSFQEGDVKKLPFDNSAFDWAWSSDCVGYAPYEPLPILKELVRVVKPGGVVAILAWSSQQLLPGHPLLEARLNATSAGIAPFVEGKRPQLHFPRALGWFHDADLVEPAAQTFVDDVHAPLSDDIRAALTSFFDMRWGGARSEVSKDDWEKYRRLCEPESPDFILNLPDYYAFFTYSLFSGKVVKG